MAEYKRALLPSQGFDVLYRNGAVCFVHIRYCAKI